MSTPDIINAGFEFGSSLAVWWNIRQIWLDKGYAGQSLWSLLFFTCFGAWNLYYYPFLHQWASFSAGCSLFIANCIWISLCLFYGKKNETKNETKTKDNDRDLLRAAIQSSVS